MQKGSGSGAEVRAPLRPPLRWRGPDWRSVAARREQQVMSKAKTRSLSDLGLREKHITHPLNLRLYDWAPDDQTSNDFLEGAGAAELAEGLSEHERLQGGSVVGSSPRKFGGSRHRGSGNLSPVLQKSVLISVLRSPASPA